MNYLNSIVLEFCNILKALLAILFTTMLSCEHYDCREVLLDWDIYISNFRSYSIKVSIWNDISDTTSIRNKYDSYNKNGYTYQVCFNTSVDRTDSAQDNPLYLNPGESGHFMLRYIIRNIYYNPKVEGRYQFFERIEIDSSAQLKDSVFVNIYCFPEDSLKSIANLYSTDKATGWDIASVHFSDTLRIYSDNINGTMRYLNYSHY